MKKLLLLCLSILLFGAGNKVFWNSSPTCSPVEASLTSALSGSKLFFNSTREKLINQKVEELADEINKENLLTAKKYENFEIIKALSQEIAYEKKKSTYLLEKSNILDEIESDLLILENSIQAIENEFLTIKVKQ